MALDFFEEANRAGKTCLQIGVMDGEGGKFGPNWISVRQVRSTRLHRLSRRHQCTALRRRHVRRPLLQCDLEHVPEPTRAIAEFLRVLKPGGSAWVEVPMTYPYHEAPKDYWRVTPDGLRLWMVKFDEVACGISYLTRSPLACGASLRAGSRPPNPHSAKRAVLRPPFSQARLQISRDGSGGAA